MTILLAIETSTEMASVAILGKNGLIWRELSGVQTHSQGILPAIQELLSEAGLSLGQCDAIAFGCGPGAFTGVRTACGIVQGLAFGADLPILPVISLHAMAEAARQDGVETGVEAQPVADFVCILDARMSEVYWAHYRYADQRWEPVVEPALSSFALALDYAQSNGFLAVLGNGLIPPAEQSEIKVAGKVTYKMPHARQVAQLGLLDYAQGKQVAADLAQPLYLRNKIALTTLERMQLKAAGGS